MSAFEFGKVAVLVGGISAEREVSLLSGAAVFDALVAEGVDAHMIDANPDNIGALQEQGFDRAFIVLHGRWGEDGVVQGALEAVGMPYTGSGVLGCALAMDKLRCKQVWQALGLPTARYKVLSSDKDLEEVIDALGLPLFLKPTREGSSVGIGKVNHADELLKVYQNAQQCGGDVLAEEYLSGAEVTVGILHGKALPAITMRTNNEFYDYQAKYESDDTVYDCPAGLGEELESKVRGLALAAAQAVDVTGWGRVDMILDAQRQPMLLEVNTVPGMTSHSLVPIAAAENGLSFAMLVKEILKTSMRGVA